MHKEHMGEQIDGIVMLFVFKLSCRPHLLLHTVSSVHVFDVIEEVTDWVHVAEMLAVLVHRLEHLIKGHADLK